MIITSDSEHREKIKILSDSAGQNLLKYITIKLTNSAIGIGTQRPAFFQTYF